MASRKVSYFMYGGNFLYLLVRTPPGGGGGGQEGYQGPRQVGA
jgi:hypothetical protein